MARFFRRSSEFNCMESGTPILCCEPVEEKTRCAGMLNIWTRPEDAILPNDALIRDTEIVSGAARGCSPQLVEYFRRFGGKRMTASKTMSERRDRAEVRTYSFRRRHGSLPQKNATFKI